MGAAAHLARLLAWPLPAAAAARLTGPSASTPPRHAPAEGYDKNITYRSGRGSARWAAAQRARVAPGREHGGLPTPTAAPTACCRLRLLPRRDEPRIPLRRAAQPTHAAGAHPRRRYMEAALALVRRRRGEPTAIITHRLPLAEAPQAYQLFDSRAAGCIKAVLRPWPQRA